MPLLQLCRQSSRIAQRDADAFRERQDRELDLFPRWMNYRAALGETTWGAGLGVTTLSPDERLEALIGALDRLDTLGYERSPQQKLFHKAFIVATLKYIYGREVHRHIGRLMRRFGVSEIRPDVIVCAIRRAGKTFAVALFAAAFVLTQPGVEINIYSTCKRASRKLQALIWTIIVRLAGTQDVVVTYNQEELVVRCGNTTSRVNSLPGSVEISFSFPALLCCLSLSPRPPGPSRFPCG